MEKDDVVLKLKLATEKAEIIAGSVEQLKAETKEKDSKFRQQKSAYEEMKKILQKAEDDFIHSRDSLRVAEGANREVQEEINALQRELGRILDAERINNDYLSSVNALREGSLSATWRGENRDDGFGAYAHQIDGAIHLAVAGRALLGDHRGLGKSLTSLIYADLKDSLKTIVISPRDTQNNYIREVARWTPHRMPIKIGQMPKAQRDFILNSLQISPTFTLILNYEAWRKDEKLIQQLVDLRADTVIVDEAHNAKESRSLVAKGIKELVFGLNECPSCGLPRVKQDTKEPWRAKCACGYEGHITEFTSVKNYLPMTGTPILNKPEELFPHLHLIDPEHFPSERAFKFDFTVKKGQRSFWKYGAQKQVMSKIGPRYLARDRQTTGVVVPPNEEIEHYISMEEMQESYPRQHKAYQQAKEMAQIALDPGNSELVMSFPYLITQLQRLRQILVWPNAIELKVLDPETFEPTGEIIPLNVKESIKIDKSEQLIREFLEEGHRVVLFSQFRPGLSILQERLGERAAIYSGSTSARLRNEIQIDFDATIKNAHPRWDVLLGVYKSGGTGLNFTGASQGILLDREWNFGKEDQAVGRWDRIGQTRDTQTHQMIVESSVDIWMKELIEEKKNMTDSFEDVASLYQRTYDKLRNGEI